VLENTAAGCELHTDGNNSYLKIPDRKHIQVVLRGPNALPAHIPFARIHRVFSNLKRWGLGTFHGFRAKHMNAYLNEFVFRWNRKRSLETTMDTLLGIGQVLPRTTYRDIVGDTSEWRRAHQAQILKMVAPSRLSVAKTIAAFRGIALIDALDEVGPTIVKRPRKVPKRLVLPPRRLQEPRSSLRSAGRPRLDRAEVEAGWMWHVPLQSPILRA
jgi:hypothetical protein